MSCLLDWPRAVDTATIDVEGTVSELDEDETGHTLDWSFQEVWDRLKLLPAGPLNRCQELIPQMTPRQWGATAQSCHPTAPTVEVNEPAAILSGPDAPGPDLDLTQIGTWQDFLEGVEDGAAKPLFGLVGFFRVYPAWNSEVRPLLVSYAEEGPPDVAPGQTITIDDVPGVVLTHQEQTVTAGSPGSARAMTGSVIVSWEEPPRDSGGEREFRFLILWTRTANATVSQTTPIPTWTAWASGAAYLEGDVISHGGSNWEAIRAHEDVIDIPSDREDLWRIFDIFNHVEVTRLHNGVRFAFLGRYAAAVALEPLVEVSGTVKGYNVTLGQKEVEVRFDLYYEGLPDPITSDPTYVLAHAGTLRGACLSSLPGDDFDAVLTNTVSEPGSEISEQVTLTFT